MSSTTTATQHVTSADGTPIAFRAKGEGPALVLVDGALCHRGMGPSRALTEQLAGAFTVLSYDRRGRGDSGAGASPYAVDREVEDLIAVIGAAGGHAHVLGVSSGGVLALEAARGGAPMDRLAIYEAPFIVDGTHPPNDLGLPQRMRDLTEAGRRSEAVRTFMRTVGAPAPMVALMRLMPVWGKLKAVAHTLAHDLELIVPFEQGRPLPVGYYDAVSVPTLVMVGGRSPEYMHNAQAAIAEAVPDARLEVLPRQTHMVRANVVGPRLTVFLQS
jgi:pimeloyl-ACP methyl ester carboxylesterase